MKKIIFVTAVVLFAILCFSSCDKYNKTDTDFIYKEAPKPINVGIFRVTLHRATNDRPRDHKKCGCMECFGFCDFEWFPNIEKNLSKSRTPFVEGSDIDHSIVCMSVLDESHAIMYIMEKREYFEDELGVDAPIFVPDEVICGLQCNAKSIMVNEGEYKFVQEEQYVTINKRKFVSYGYVIVDITMR